MGKGTSTLAVAVVAALCGEAGAELNYNVAASGWPSAAHRDAAVAAIQSSVNRYNAYGDFGSYNVHVYYNAGIPTAQANYLGSIGFGGTYPNERVMMHELAHYLGSGTYGDPWNGARGEALVDQFDGLEATLQGDANHFWPYGLNYDSEGSEINKQRQVAMVYAQRADMGIGSTANPWSERVVSLTRSDILGESGFNYAAAWSDNRFAHPGAVYSTGNFYLRTPASGNSFTFVGDSVTVNNTNGINGGLLYKGTGTTAVVRFNNLILNGGYVRHTNGAGDLFQLAGTVTLASTATIDAAQGNITISANIGGNGSFTKAGSFTLTLTGANSYTGATTINSGTLSVTPTAISAGTNVTVNGGTYAMSGGMVFGPASLTINSGGQATLASGGDKTLNVTGLTVNAGGKLVLNDNDLIVNHNGSLNADSICQLVRNGRANGSTSGIFTTRGPTVDDVVLAVVDNAEWGKATFNGLAIDASTIVGKYAYFGDANLDGQVTGDDYLAVDAGLGTGTTWLRGDFNLDGAVTGDDYLAIDANLGKGTATPLAYAEMQADMVALHAALFGDSYLAKFATAQESGFGTLVPEPASLAAAAVLAFAPIASRRRRGASR